MSLHDLEICQCDHPRHAHEHSWARNVFGKEETVFGGCKRCQCKGFIRYRYITKTGRELTEEDFERLADEAEQGYDVGEIPRWIAPWTQAQIDVLSEYQRSGHFHPYTCGNDSTHPVLVPTTDGWVCEACDYRQAWAHAHAALDQHGAEGGTR